MTTPATLVGLAIGDSAGFPYETLNDKVHPLLATWDGKFAHGTRYDLPPGSYSDDTEMAFALSQSLTACNGYNPDDAAKRYVAWIRGTPFGAGGTVKKALENYHNGATWQDSGVTFTDAHKVGSGTAMRIAPMGAWYRNGFVIGNPDNKLLKFVRQDAEITHKHTEAVAAAYAVAVAVALAREHDDPLVWLCSVRTAADDVGVNLTSERLFSAYKLHGTGIDTDGLVNLGVLGRRGNAWQVTSSALWCAYLNWTSFADGIKMAVKLGGDCDTRAAITGAVLGTRLGLEGIPEYYKDDLKDLEIFESLDYVMWQPRV